MPYIINRTSGLAITTVQDGTINSAVLDLTLVGKNYTGYGEIFNENFVKLLENFSNTTAPKKPLSGQLWFNSASKTLRLYVPNSINPNDTLPWKSLSVLETSASKPLGYNQGDLWYDTTVPGGRLWAYTGVGTTWTLVGPITTRGSSSGAIEGLIKNSDTTLDEIVLDQRVNNSNAFISSSIKFPVDVTDPNYANFNIIKEGITLPGTDANGVSYTPIAQGYVMWGTAATALGFVRNNVYVPASSFLVQTDLTSISNPIITTSDDGITVGVQNVLKLHVTNSTVGNISVIGGSTLKFNTLYNGNPTYNIFSITTGSSNDPRILPNSTATVYLGTATQAFAYGYINTITATTITSTTISGITVNATTVNATTVNAAAVAATTITATAIYDSTARVLTTATIGSYGVSYIQGTANKVSVNTNQGSVTVSLPDTLDITVQNLRSTGSSKVYGAWTLDTGATFQATYADLAERYAADAEYAPGTVLVIGGDAEVTTTERHGNTAVAGIVSTNPAFTLNAQAGEDITHPYIALKGRVPCRVMGPISKGDLLVTSTVSGHAERAHANDNPNAVLGRALEDFEDSSSGLIEVMVA
jgi:hypothetical protein